MKYTITLYQAGSQLLYLINIRKIFEFNSRKIKLFARWLKGRWCHQQIFIHHTIRDWDANWI